MLNSYMKGGELVMLLIGLTIGTIIGIIGMAVIAASGQARLYEKSMRNNRRLLHIARWYYGGMKSEFPSWDIEEWKLDND